MKRLTVKKHERKKETKPAKKEPTIAELMKRIEKLEKALNKK